MYTLAIIFVAIVILVLLNIEKSYYTVKYSFFSKERLLEERNNLQDYIDREESAPIVEPHDLESWAMQIGVIDQALSMKEMDFNIPSLDGLLNPKSRKQISDGKKKLTDGIKKISKK